MKEVLQRAHRKAHHRLWAAYEVAAMGLGLSSLAVLCMGWFPFAMLLHPVMPSRLGKRLGRFAISAGFRVYVQVLRMACACQFDLSELDTLRGQGPLIIAANHPSLLDAVLVTSRLPNVVCVMKSRLMHNPLLGSAARLAGYIPNGGMLQIVQHSREALQGGAQVLIFPEGTRTRLGAPIDPLTGTLGLIASRSGVAVQSVTLEFSSPYLGKGWSLFRKPSLPLHVRARLGRRFEAPHTDHNTLTQDLERYFRRVLDSSICGRLPSKSLTAHDRTHHCELKHPSGPHP